MKPLTWSSRRINPRAWNLPRLSNVSGFVPQGKLLETPRYETVNLEFHTG